MALTNCRECGKELSDQAATCPHCGAPNVARRKPFKWWLWLPIGGVAAFLALGAMQPAYRTAAIKTRDFCLKAGGTQAQCQRLYDERIKAGDTCPIEAPGCSWGR